MNNDAPPVTYMGRETPIKRRPWMTAADAEMLNSLPPEAARVMHNLLLQQARSDQRFRTRQMSADPDMLDALSMNRVASRYGAGGGRRRGLEAS